MPTRLYLSELNISFEWVSAAGRGDNAAYASRASGRIFWESESGDLDEELPSDAHDEALYAPVPHKQDFDLGQRLIFRFIDAHAPDGYEEVRGFFSRRGAYGRYKDFLERRGLLDGWYEYEELARETALKEWAQAEGFEIVEGKRDEAEVAGRAILVPVKVLDSFLLLA